MRKIHRPNDSDAPEWYPFFLKKAPGDDLLQALESSKLSTLALIGSIPASLESFSYAEGKWNIRQLFIHLADEERYYAYKSFCYSRQMDVNLEIPMSANYTLDFNAQNRTLKDIAEEYEVVRDASISLYATMTDEMLDFNGFPDKEPYTARSLGWFTVGHNLHHCNVLKEKYLER